MGIKIASNADGVFEVTSGNVRVARPMRDIITIQHRGHQRKVTLNASDLDDAIAALQALRGDWQPAMERAELEALRRLRDGVLELRDAAASTVETIDALEATIRRP